MADIAIRRAHEGDIPSVEHVLREGKAAIAELKSEPGALMPVMQKARGVLRSGSVRPASFQGKERGYGIAVHVSDRPH